MARAFAFHANEKALADRVHELKGGSQHTAAYFVTQQ